MLDKSICQGSHNPCVLAKGTYPNHSLNTPCNKSTYEKDGMMRIYHAKVWECLRT